MRRSRLRHRNHSEPDQRDRWMISYADLVTLLLAFFVVLYAASDRERAKRVAESFANPKPDENYMTGKNGVLPGTNAVTDALTDEEAKIESILSQNPAFKANTKITRTQAGLIVSLSEAGFFAAGEAAISEASLSEIRTLAAALTYSNTAVRVEGHTDSTPISTARYPSNWELSTARASAVLAKLIEYGVQPARLSAAGFGGEHPVADNSSPEGRAQNRRVDIVVLNN